MVHDLAAELPLCEVVREGVPAGPPRPPRPVDRNLAAGVAEGIALAGGVRIDGFLEVQGRSALGISGISSRGGALGVEILARVESGEEVSLARLEPGTKAEAWEIPGEGDRLVRWTLRATGDAAAWAIVRKPVVRSLSPPPSPVPDPPKRTATKEASRPNVLLYLIDTLRADRLGVYGSTRGLTPRIDDFARRSVVLERTTAASSWTKPSTATILTGLAPQVHGATRLERRLPPTVRSLAEVLKEAGYRTGGWSANAHVTETTGFDQGFDRFEFLPDVASADLLAARARAWLDEKTEGGEAAAPFFLYLHAIDPHAPYEPPEDLRRRFAPQAPASSGRLPAIQRVYRALDRKRPEARAMLANLSALYDADIAAVDRSFGALLDELGRRGDLARTLVVVISDHGEEFGEHGALGHGRTLHREVLDVPWIVHLPGQTAGRRISEPAAHLDVMPTLLSALGIPATAAFEAGLRGIDRLAVRDAASPPEADRPLFSHLDYEGRQGGSVRLGDWHLVDPWSRKFGRSPRLFNFATDPAETRDLAAEKPVRTGYLRSLLRAEQLAVRHRAAASAPLRPEERKALEALGYL